MYEYISASVDSRLSFVCHCFVRNFQIESIIIACHAIIFTIGGKASHGVARFITAVETRVHNTSREETIDCKSFLFLCNVDAKIDGKLLRKGRTLISSTRYSFPFEKVVSINMTRYSATFSNNEFSFSRFFFFFFSSSYLFDAAQVLHTFLRYYYRDINIRMTEKDMINELENSLFISILFIV